MSLSFFALTDASGRIVRPEWLGRVEIVHRQLHDFFPAGAAAYREKLERIFATGARMYLAAERETLKGVVIGRVVEDTRDIRHLHLDDVVVDSRYRRQGVGKEMMDWLEDVAAKEYGCVAITLDSRVNREGAHRFYFRENYAIVAFHFLKKIEPYRGILGLQAGVTQNS